jgi:small subunit ribosomal protein S6
MTETNFPKYELMLILQPDLGEEKTATVLKEVKELILEGEGKISHEDLWGIRDLAYTIKRQRQGFYVVLNFTANPKSVKEMEKQLNLNQAILRYLVQKTPKHHEVKTLAEYEEIAKAEELKAKEEAKAKTEKQERGDVRGRKFVKPEKTKVEAAKPAKKEEKKIEKPVKKVKKEEEIEEKVEEKPAKKKQAATLEDVDAKLKSIIDDPDITL